MAQILTTCGKIQLKNSNEEKHMKITGKKAQKKKLKSTWKKSRKKDGQKKTKKRKKRKKKKGEKGLRKKKSNRLFSCWFFPSNRFFYPIGLFARGFLPQLFFFRRIKENGQKNLQKRTKKKKKTDEFFFTETLRIF